MILTFVLLTSMSLHSPFAIDSTIYTVDIHNMEIIEQRIGREIIDYCVDDYLYAFTDRYFYKIDPDNLSIKERIPLPQRFNYLSTNKEKIMLVTTGEIIILNKANLAFESGIGIEYSDYQPMISSLGQGISQYKQFIYLMSNSGKKTTVKILNINNGKFVRKIEVNRMVYYEYDPQTATITTLDTKNKLIVYDMNFRRRSVIDLDFDSKRFSKYENGYLIYNQHGVFYVNKTGEIIDFQPIAFQEKSAYENFMFLTENSILYLDSLTLRPKQLQPNEQKIEKLYHIDYTSLVIGLDADNDFHLINMNTMTAEPIAQRKPITKEVEPVIHTTGTDSLWYFQIGAFAQYDNAMEMYNEFWQDSIPVFIESAELFRIKFGGFQNRNSAIGIIEKLNLNGWFVFQKKIEQREDGIEFFVGFDKYILEQGIIKRSKI